MLYLFVSVYLTSDPQSYVSSEHPEGQSQIQEVMRVLIEGLSKHHNSTLLLAIREVKVQTPEPSSSRGQYLTHTHTHTHTQTEYSRIFRPGGPRFRYTS